MALSSVDNFLVDLDNSNDQSYSNNEEFPFAAFESIFKRIELGSHPTLANSTDLSKLIKLN